jgi:hypothetical protein
MRALAFLPLLVACSGDEALLASGTYEAYDATVDGAGAETVPAVRLTLDIEGGTASFTDDSGAALAEVSLALWDEADWLEGCPTNFSATREQAASLDVDAITLGDITVDTPILVASCPDGASLVLRDDGETGGGGPCIGATACVMFE